MGKVNCVKCKKRFEEARDRWPSTVCDDCMADTKCTKKGCGKKVAVDPTVQHGLDYCKLCRVLVCHFCGQVDKFCIEKTCPRCYDQHVLACADTDACLAGVNLVCIPSHQKVPPSTFDAIKLSSERRQIAQKALPVTKEKLQLRLGAVGADKLAVEKASEADARDYAIEVYKKLLEIRLGRKSKLGFTTEESTYAVTLLVPNTSPDHFRIVITYSQYKLTYTDTNIRENPTLGAAIIDADPEYELVKEGTHRIRRNGIWSSYVRDASNEHHAEARALEFATQNKMVILNIFPTKWYCQTGSGGGCLADVGKRLTDKPFKENNELIEEIFKST